MKTSSKLQILLLLCVFNVYCYPNYPGSCTTTPFQNPHSTTIMADTGATITVSNIGTGYHGNSPTAYTVNIQTSNTMVGFLFFATASNGNHVGSFTPNAALSQQTLGNFMYASCPGTTTLGHNAKVSTTTMTATWNAPPAGTGPVTFNLFYVGPGGSPYPSYSALSAVIPEGTPFTGTYVTSATIATSANTAQQTNNGAQTSGGGTALSTGAIIGIALGSFFGILCIALFIAPIVYVRKREEARKSVLRSVNEAVL